MATTTYLSNPSVTVGAVDLTDNCSAATLTVGYDSLETTAFGDTGRKYTKGLQNVEVTLTLFNSYGASEIEATLYGLVGDGDTTIVIKPEAGAASATNPSYTITNAMLATFTPVVTSVGELSQVEVTFTGGTFARAIA
jgi:hypothetical protein